MFPDQIHGATLRLHFYASGEVLLLLRLDRCLFLDREQRILLMNPSTRTLASANLEQVSAGPWSTGLAKFPGGEEQNKSSAEF